jgi:PTH1 family peptidyl-tRNA hydrolase
MFFGKKLPVTWLVVGLGNPGDKYENTRHNAGFMAIDQLADRGDFPVQRLKFHALTHQATISGQGVLVMKPTTYMNLSGDAVAEAAAFYKVSPDHILVLCDDVSLPVGKLRIRTSGSAGGHNGLKHIIQRLGTDQFPRVKIGVGGKPHPDYDMADWVLGKFVGEDKTTMDAATLRAAQAVECYLKDGPQKAMNQFN